MKTLRWSGDHTIAPRLPLVVIASIALLLSACGGLGEAEAQSRVTIIRAGDAAGASADGGSGSAIVAPVTAPDRSDSGGDELAERAVGDDAAPDDADADDAADADAAGLVADDPGEATDNEANEAAAADGDSPAGDDVGADGTGDNGDTDSADVGSVVVAHDGIGPMSGTEVVVFGVAFDEVLRVRVAPDDAARILGRIEPPDGSAVSTGGAEASGRDTWLQVFTPDSVGGELAGWVPATSVGVLGSDTDQTDFFVAFFAGPRTEDTMEELGFRIAFAHAAVVQELSGNSIVPGLVQSTEVEVQGRSASVTYDVLGDLDSAVRGVRLVITADVNTDGSFTLDEVVQTVVCNDGLGEARSCA